jgi:hypothetical protein
MAAAIPLTVARRVVLRAMMRDKLSKRWSSMILP